MIRSWIERITLKKQAIRKKTYFLYVFDSVPPFYAKERIATIALRSVAVYKRVTLSDLLPSLMTKEWRERFALFHERVALSLTKNEQFARETNERIPNPFKNPDRPQYAYQGGVDNRQQRTTYLLVNGDKGDKKMRAKNAENVLIFMHWWENIHKRFNFLDIRSLLRLNV